MMRDLSSGVLGNSKMSSPAFDILVPVYLFTPVLDFPPLDPYDACIMTMETMCTISRCSADSHSSFFWYYFMVDHPALA